MSNLAEVTTATFKTEVLSATTPVLVDFYAPWCGPCKMIAPLLDKLSGEYAGKVKFVKINVDDAGELATQYQITGVPTLMILNGGKVADTIVGAASPRAIKSKLDEVLGVA